MSYFIGNFEDMLDGKKLVRLITLNYENMPKEMLDSGIIVDSLPIENPPSGKSSNGLYYNPITNELAYEYVTTPTPVDEMSEMKSQIADLWEMVLFGGEPV